MRLPILPALLLLCSLAPAGRLSAAASGWPTVLQPLGEIYPGRSNEGNWWYDQVGPDVTVDLRAHFGVQDLNAANPVVLFDTILGKFAVELLPTDAPATVANFLKYVDAEYYTETVIHRSIPDFMIQGGGWVITPPATGALIEPIDTFAPIALEYKLPNARGTIAMARTSVLNSATSEWFINTVDNTTNLGQSNGGGYAVFGRVLGDGLKVVDALAALPNFYANASLANLPLYNYTTQDALNQKALVRENMVRIHSIQRAEVSAAAASGASILRFEVTVDHPEWAQATIESGRLQVLFQPLCGGPVEITVRALDWQGNSVTDVLRTAPNRALAVLPESFDLANGWVWSTWFDFYNADFYPWIYTNQHGWWYLMPDPAGGFWGYDLTRGDWLWTGPGFYPWVYLTGSAAGWANLQP